MYTSSHLLPEPGGEVVRECIVEIRRLRLALTDVCNPLGRLEREAEANGCVLNGSAAATAKNHIYLQEIAREALDYVKSPEVVNSATQVEIDNV